MVGTATSVAVVGVDAVLVTVEAHFGQGLPGLHVIGASNQAGREAADRVKVGLASIGLSLPQRKGLVSLAPADVPTVGARYDLAMAVALAAHLGEVTPAAVDATGFVAEVSLDGSLRPVTGVLPSAGALAAAGYRRLVVAEANAVEASLVGGIDVVGAGDLAEVVGVLSGDRQPRPLPEVPHLPARAVPDLADVRGQDEARRALEIAAAGGHHLLLLGPPGCGKSMLASRLPGILPPLARTAALEVAAVRSVAGVLDERHPLDHRPPLSAPHQGASTVALLGGGSGIPRPGALSLAHRGVLVLDELLEWPRSSLDALRGPLQDGVVRLARSRATVTYPAAIQLVGCANPCPCGGGVGCACPDDVIWAYRSKLSGALADRLDLAPTVERLRAADLTATAPAEDSATVAARVTTARAVAAARWGDGVANAAAPASAVARTADPAARHVLANAVETGELTGRGHDRALRVARTIADLDGEETIGVAAVHEARAHRRALSPPPVVGLAS